MKKQYKITTMLLVTFVAIAFIVSSCSSNKSALVSNKSGAQLWGENCIRCHSIPSPSAYNDVDWETIGLHMQIRANLTKDEITKVVEFMQTAN
ncbi:MAG: cytochrome c [Chlorobi bacterium]|nr:cytochrome c [Chlorobiota bacterium]